MTRYIAFLRALNVGGANVITMEELRRALESAGLKGARTYLQSGNVILEEGSGGTHALEGRIQEALLKKRRMHVSVMVRTQEELGDVVVGAPPSARRAGGSKVFVTFLKDVPNVPPPKRSAKGDVVFLGVRPREVYSVGLEVKGHFGNPNAPLEKALGVAATTRYLSVVEELAKDCG